MTTENLTIEAGAQYTHSFAYEGADPATDLLTLNFYFAGIYLNGILVKSEKLGGVAGEIAVGNDVYNINIPSEKTVLLPSSNLTYKLYKIDPVTLAADEIYTGTVTVTGGSSSQVALKPYSNNNYVPAYFVNAGSPSLNDRIIYWESGQEDDPECLLEDARAVVGKIFTIRNIGLGDVIVFDSLGGELFRIQPNTSITIHARGVLQNDWQLI